MAELLSPGIFIEERQSQVQQITAVSTSNFATVGWTPRGPENEATLVTSLDQFFQTFGGFTKFSDAAYGMTGFFQNGGARAYFVRVAPDDAELAVGNLASNYQFKASSRGAWGNLLKVRVVGSRNYYDSATASYTRFDVLVLEETEDGSGAFDTKESFEALDLANEDSAQYILTVLNADNTGSDLVKVLELSGEIPTALESTQILNESIDTGDGSTQLYMHTLAQPVVAVDTFQLSVAGSVVAVDDGEGSLSGTGVSGTIDYESGDVAVFFTSAPANLAAITASYYKAGAEYVEVDLAGGSDGDPSSIGRGEISAAGLKANKKGIFAFDQIDEILNLGLMDFSDNKEISIDLIAYAEERKDVFLIFDAGPGKNVLQAVRYKRLVLGSLSEYAAMYWPRVKVSDELKDGVSKVISPIGHIAGVYARTDIERNVGKTPAGVDDGQLNGILELEFRTTKGDRDVAYPAALNPLRADTYVGKAVWGGKTLAITGDFTRINARRLFMFLEKSTFNNTHDLVFENIGAQLFARIKLRMDGFLTVLFEDGYFRGATPEEAFKVVVDESNNPPAITNARQVIVDIFIAVNEPAEFIRFRFQRQFPTT